MTKGEEVHPAASAATTKGRATVLRLPITNIYDGSAYSAQLSIGSRGRVANVLLDTGSSTLAVQSSVYDGTGDTALSTTSFAQLITYGAGGWAGPVVATDVRFGDPGNAIVLKQASLAIAVIQEGSLGNVNGVMGLAYGGENPAYDFAGYFADKGSPNTTLPWPFGAPAWDRFLSEFQTIVQSDAVARKEVAPYLDQLENNGLLPNKFAFYTLRSSVSMRLGDDQGALASDPLNSGVFVLGGGEEQDDLYEGEFVSVAVVHDLFYNTNLTSVRVEGCAAVAAARLQSAFRTSLISNAIIDSGNDALRLASDVYHAVLAGFAELNPAFAAAVQAAQKGSIATARLNLAAWPKIYFTFSGVNGEDVELAIAPNTYWQQDFPKAGQSTFKITGPLLAANQSNLGLPLLNNYYTVFDRSQGSQGVVRFAPIKLPAPIPGDAHGG
ncbi:MAG: pepsin-like aspartic protease [Caulobacteraceae bacterium]